MARSTFPSQTVQNTSSFWKLTRRKSARRCCAKRMSKSKVQKTYGALLDVQMSFPWPAQGIVHLVKSEQNLRVL